MFRLKIQLFGGRGHRCGVGSGIDGPGIGIATGMEPQKGSGKDNFLEVYPEYPDFPDPDYSNFYLTTNDEFIKNTFNLLDYKRVNHDETAKKYLKSLNLKSNITYTNLNNDLSYGYVYSYVDPLSGITQVYRYNLNQADTRRMEYKVKTMFHEGYHAADDGLLSESIGMKEYKYKFHEETRTEIAAMFLAHKINGYSYVPSYPLEVVSAAAKYVRMDQYKDCKTLYDLGERFYKDRMVNRKNPSFKVIEEEFMKIHLDDSYYKKYYKNIIKNKEKYYNICRNSLMNFKYFDNDYEKVYKTEFDSMINKLLDNDIKKLNKAEGNLFIQCVALDMNEGGVL